MKLFSGRLDKINEQSISDLHSFFKKIECTKYIVAFENKTKAGLECKEHYHFLFYLKDAPKSTDSMRRHLTKLGYAGTLASLCDIEKNGHTEEKTFHYVLKQGDVKISQGYSFDELADLVSKSQQYQQTIKINKKDDIINTIIEFLQQYYEANKDIDETIKQKSSEWNEIVKATSPTQTYYVLSYQFVTLIIFKYFKQGEVTPPLGYKLKELMVKIGMAVYTDDVAYSYWMHTNMNPF